MTQYEKVLKRLEYLYTYECTKGAMFALPDGLADSVLKELYDITSDSIYGDYLADKQSKEQLIDRLREENVSS